MSHPGLFHIEQVCQESLTQGKIHNNKIQTMDSNIRKAKFQRVLRFKVIWSTSF